MLMREMGKILSEKEQKNIKWTSSNRMPLFEGNVHSTITEVC